MDAPFLLVSNHVTNFDPFLVGMASKETPLSFVASEHIFRLGFISKLITKLVDPIPRSKAASGAGTVKNCLRRLKNGESVALFAEGDCTWDGVSTSVFPATGKLAKAAGVPLVTFRIEGGYLTSPRWSKKKRVGRMHGSVVNVYTQETLKGMSSEETDAAINRDIYENEWERQRENKVAFKSKCPAEKLERAFVICPGCGAAASLISKGDFLYCPVCGFETHIDEYGFFADDKPFPTAHEWNEWQKGAILRMVNDKSPASKPVSGRLTLLDDKEKSRARTVEAAVDTERGRFIFGDMELAYSDISDMSMVKTNRLLFTCESGYYEFKSKKGALRLFLLIWQAARDAI